MSQFSSILQELRKGMNGESLWIPMRHPSLSKNVGITKRLYHLIGGDPGSGKTAFVDQTYVLDPHDWASRHSDKVKIKTIYFSMERSKVYKKTKWLAYRLYTQNSILRSINDLLSFGTANHPMTEELISVAETHEEYFDNLFADVKVVDGSQNPTGILKSLYNFALENGIIYGRDENSRYYKTTYESWNRPQGQRQIYIESNECPIQLAGAYEREYVPNDPKLILQVVCDHFGRINSEMGLNTKQTIDKASKILSDMRDLFGYSVVGVSQFNRNNANIQRRINTDLTPEQQDFKDSGNTYEDADIVLALFNPMKHGLKTYKGYNITLTKPQSVSRFRAMTLLKNSYGVDDLIAGFKFVGECGYYEQLGKPTEINYEQTFSI